MSNTPEDFKYTKDHEWVRDNGDGTVTVGITDHAQDALGELVFVELPEVGRQVERGDACAVVESVKTASDIYSPAGGVVTEANEALSDAPGIINDEPYGKGWIFKIQVSDSSQLDELLDAAGYEAILVEEA
jgi:glycine cleavage system H protein